MSDPCQRCTRLEGQVAELKAKVVVLENEVRQQASNGEARPPDLADLGLSPREREVLELIAQGHSTREIAGRLYLSVNSIKTHTRAVYRKLGVHTRSQAAVWYLSRYGPPAPAPLDQSPSMN